MARRRYQNGCLFKRGKNWVLRYREDMLNPDGTVRRAHRSIVLGPLETKKEARRMAGTYLAQFNDGTRRAETAITLEDFWHGYFATDILPVLKFSTQEAYRYLANYHLLPCFGRQQLSEITRLDIQRLVGQKFRQGYAPKTLTHLRNLLSRIFQVAVSWGWLNDNLAHGITLPPMEARRQARLLTEDEIARLSQALDQPARTIFLTGILAGLRIGEILALRIEDLNLTSGWVNVRRNVYRGHVQDAPKTKRSERQIPLASLLIRAIQQWLERRPDGSDWLFPSEAGTPHRDRNLLRRKFDPVCKKLGVPRFNWHSLRHAFTTYNQNSGVPTPVVQSLLGHASAETTMIYTHPLAEAQRQAVEKLAGILFPNVPHCSQLGEGSG